MELGTEGAAVFPQQLCFCAGAISGGEEALLQQQLELLRPKACLMAQPPRPKLGETETWIRIARNIRKARDREFMTIVISHNTETDKVWRATL